MRGQVGEKWPVGGQSVASSARLSSVQWRGAAAGRSGHCGRWPQIADSRPTAV